MGIREAGPGPGAPGKGGGFRYSTAPSQPPSALFGDFGAGEGLLTRGSLVSLSKTRNPAARRTFQISVLLHPLLLLLSQPVAPCKITTSPRLMEDSSVNTTCMHPTLGRCKSSRCQAAGIPKSIYEEISEQSKVLFFLLLSRFFFILMI